MKYILCLAVSISTTICPAQAIELKYIAAETDRRLEILEHIEPDPNPPIAFVIHGSIPEQPSRKKRIAMAVVKFVAYGALVWIAREL